ncbi:MAG: proline racemase family protein [Akkermansiaceae bacterium]
MNKFQRIQVIDSHTGGEPSRVVISGAPEPQGQTMAEKRVFFREEMDWLRTAVVCEPRGHDAMVGALICAPLDSSCVCGVIFFNNVDVLNGCIHATIGLAVTLHHLGRIALGAHRIETPTGVVTITLMEGGKVTVKNVRSYRIKTTTKVSIPNYGEISGDVAWGGNWFFLANAPLGVAIELQNIEELTRVSWDIREALTAEKITGDDGGEIDHVELFAPPTNDSADSKNFVLCPGKAYDRSPCGTGTSAKLACLAADGLLSETQTWRQAGILDTVFEGQIRKHPDGGISPIITGSAFITAEADLLLDPEAPFAFGISSPHTPTHD